MAHIVPASIEYEFAYITSTCGSSRANICDLIDKRIQETVSDMKSTLSAMACVGCGGNIDPQTLSCKCCGRQYRLVASDEQTVHEIKK